MSDIFYSVEWLPKSDHSNCWGQHALTDSKWSARLHAMELWLQKGRNHRIRIRRV